MSDKSQKTVVVGMSGGVDSSVTALLLKEQGYRVIGLFMKNWEDDDSDSYCHAQDDFDDVAQVCEQIGIPYYSVNFAKEYWERVFSVCLKDFEAGYTPNPDILCNQEIKFKIFFEKALSLGADYLATGHYCRKLMINGNACLAKGMDPLKDQSYFLYTLKEKILQRVLFPIGELPKTEVRALAEKHGLATAKKKDSTGICFIGKRNFKTFLERYCKKKPGNFETPEGKIIAQHDGVAFYTIGQRKGLNIGGPGEAWFVVGKDIERNVVIITQGADHPALYTRSLITSEMSWVNEAITSFPYRCHAKVRYRQNDAACTLVWERDGQIYVEFDEDQRAVTPRQSIVLYQGNQCLGGGIIQSDASK
jgi:tRNA-specific 2-thiouridylase